MLRQNAVPQGTGNAERGIRTDDLYLFTEWYCAESKLVLAGTGFA